MMMNPTFDFQFENINTATGDSVHMVECSDMDDVCFTDDKRLEEYVLADVGKIWMG